VVEYVSCEAAGANPGNGIINFDNTYFAWITIFQATRIAFTAHTTHGNSEIGHSDTTVVLFLEDK